MSKAAAIFLIILGVALLAGVAFGVYVLLEATNYCQSKVTDFWVKVDDHSYYADDEIVFSDTDIEVHYLVEWLSRKKGYSYKILPTGSDFGYIVNGSTGNWLGIEDLTSAFEIAEREDGLTIKAKGKKITDVLQAINPGRTVVAPTSEDSNFHFKLVVTSLDGKSIALTFRCTIAVESIEIDPPAIVV